MIVLPSQLGSAFATARCSPNGTVRKIVSALSASSNDLATTFGPIARACGSSSAGERRLATVTSMSFRANAWASACPILPNPTLAELEASLGTATRSDLRHAASDGELDAGNVRTLIRGEECNCCRDFFGLA